MAALNGRAFFAAVVTILAIIVVLLVILVYRRNQIELENQSIQTTDPCTAPPSVPTNIFISNPQGDLLIVEFLASRNSTSYQTQISSVANFNDSQVEQERITSTNSAAFGNLSLGAPYYFRVRARNACGNSDWSAYEEFTIAFNFPPQFVIAARNNPGLEACDNFNDVFVPAQTNQVSAKTFCSDIESFYFYEPVDQSLRQVGRANFCMTRGPGSDVFNSSCSGAPSQKWTYNSIDFSLCDAADPENGCLKFTGGTNPSQQGIIFGAKSASPQTEIVINEV